MAVDDRIARLRAAPARWWAGEAEEVRTYFLRPRTPADDARWLKLQAARELGAAARQANEAPAMFEAVEATGEGDDLGAGWGGGPRGSWAPPPGRRTRRRRCSKPSRRRSRGMIWRRPCASSMKRYDTTGCLPISWRKSRARSRKSRSCSPMQER